jgi:hypothetical protein
MLRSHGIVRSMIEDDLPYAVEEWTRDGMHVERVHARAANASVARGAYDAARRLYKEALLTLRHRTRLIDRSDEERR